MKHCKSCGGALGRDCFNPQECEWITQDMAIKNQAARMADIIDEALGPREELLRECAEFLAKLGRDSIVVWNAEHANVPDSLIGEAAALLAKLEERKD